MSRRCESPVAGLVVVRIRCDQCGEVKPYQVSLNFKRHTCGNDIEWEAVRQHDLPMLDDLMFCSRACYEKYDDEYWSDNSDSPCEGGYCSAPDGDPANVDICNRHAPFVYGVAR